MKNEKKQFREIFLFDAITPFIKRKQKNIRKIKFQVKIMLGKPLSNKDVN